MQGPTDPHSSWNQLEAEFLAFHQTPLNVALHLVTTPLGLLGTFALLATLHPQLATIAAAALALSMLRRVPRRRRR